MIIRDMDKSDIPQLLEIFSQQGIEYEFPDFSEFLPKIKVLVDDSGIVRMALPARLTTEWYFLIDQSNWATPGLKMAEFERLHEAAQAEVKKLGIKDGHCWISPKCRGFIRRLMKRFGWVTSAGPENWLGLTREV